MDRRPSLLLGLVGVYAHDQNPRERLEVKHNPWLEFGLALDQVKLVETNKPVRELRRDRKSTRLNSSHLVISYAVFCLKKKKNQHSYIWRLCGHSRAVAHSGHC